VHHIEVRADAGPLDLCGEVGETHHGSLMGRRSPIARLEFLGARHRVHAADRLEQIEAERPGPYGEVAAVRQRRDRGEHGVAAAVGSEVVHVRTEGIARVQGLPHHLERSAGHVRVTDDAVRRVEEGWERVPREPDEDGVRIRDHAALVRRREEHLFCADLVARASRLGSNLERSCLITHVDAPAPARSRTAALSTRFLGRRNHRHLHRNRGSGIRQPLNPLNLDRNTLSPHIRGVSGPRAVLRRRGSGRGAHRAATTRPRQPACPVTK